MSFMIRNIECCIVDASAVGNGTYSGEEHGIILCLHVYLFARAKQDRFQLIQTRLLLQLVVD